MLCVIQVSVIHMPVLSKCLCYPTVCCPSACVIQVSVLQGTKYDSEEQGGPCCQTDCGDPWCGQLGPGLPGEIVGVYT